MTKKKEEKTKEFKPSQVVVTVVFLSLILIALLVGFSRKRVFSESLGVNLVVVNEDRVALLGVRPKEKSIVWLDLPGNLQLKVVDREAWYPASSLWGLGEIEGDEKEMVRASIQQDLGLAMAGVVRLQGEMSVDEVMRSLIDVRTRTSLNWWDRIVLYRTLTKMGSRGLIWETNLPGAVVETRQEEDGSEWRRLNESIWVWTKDLWPSEEVLSLGVTAAVYNCSEVSGKARLMSHVLESEGLRVVEVAAKEEENHRGCWFDLEIESDELEWLLERQLGCQRKNNLDKRDEVEADLTVWLGD